jgi:hypothetical protein
MIVRRTPEGESKGNTTKITGPQNLRYATVALQKQDVGGVPQVEETKWPLPVLQFQAPRQLLA